MKEILGDSDDYEFEQADIDELFDYAKNTPVKAFFPSR